MPATRVKSTPQAKRKSRPAARSWVRRGKVSRWGNSLAFRIPREVAEQLEFTDGGQVTFEMRDDGVMVRPLRKKWTEAELLKGVTPEMVGGEVDWGPPVGKEI